MSETPSAQTRVPRGTVARRLALLGIIIVVQFGLLEAGMRRWGSSEAEPGFQRLFTTDPVIGYRLAPHARTRFTTVEFDTDIAINGSGVRDDTEYGPKLPHERRIVVLGDSIVLAVQVPLHDTFCKRLEARLNAAGTGLRYRVIDAGVQGYGPVEETLFFERVAVGLQPDVVVMVLYVANDAEEAVSSAFRLDRAGAPKLDVAKAFAWSRLRRIVRTSMVLQTVRLRLVSVTDRFDLLAPPEPPLQTFAAHPAPRIARGLDLTRTAVERFVADAQAAGAKPAVVLMPARLQLDDGDYGRLRDIVRGAGGELVRDAASDRFRTGLAPVPVPLLDLLPVLRAAQPGPNLFFEHTAHLTPRGHEVVAAGLERFLRATELVAEGSGPPSVAR